MINVHKISDDCGFAICDDEGRRIDVYPPIGGRAEHRDPTVAAFNKYLSPDEARQYALLLVSAADYADTLWLEVALSAGQ